MGVTTEDRTLSHFSKRRKPNSIKRKFLILSRSQNF